MAGAGRAQGSQAAAGPSVPPAAGRVGVSEALWGTPGDKEEAAAPPARGSAAGPAQARKDGFSPSLPRLLLSLHIRVAKESAESFISPFLEPLEGG